MWTMADIDKLVREGNIKVDDFDEAKPQIAPPDEPTLTLAVIHRDGSMPEYRFALHFLEPRVEEGISLGYAHEPLTIRMVGQSYTPDFIEFLADGTLRFYEVKGAQKIPSQDRSSAKYRTTAALFENDNVQFFWAKEKKGGGFSPRKLPKQGKRDKHEFLKLTKEKSG